ncbi:hypothetical protein [Streptomyces endophytica]|uniref:Secreted protein n=1 Tax=Streptomyces endophytica TaxID=2991496 RepID=A0ABY6PF25_9ACTN|nr:hypothetical protein [Streptomyces endophytica]UZJ32371.1 hypothetical protein OJ254_21415 [Streptomyces endophytica]
MKKLQFVAGALLAATLVVPTTSAVATSAKGGGATAWTPAAGDAGRIAVKDSSHDGDPVKAEYERKASPSTKRTLWNKNGPNTTAYSGSGSRIIKFQACDENDWAPDDCSGWKAP